MATGAALNHLETEAYRASYSDGVIDLFVGASLCWIGAAWIWLPDLAGVAGVLPAVFLTAVLAARKKLVADRAGYVEWSAPRRRWEKRNAAATLLAGVLLFVLGLAVFVAVGGSADSLVFDSIGPALLAWILALIAIGLAFMMSTWRMLVYAAALTASGAVAAMVEANPGWPLLASGAVVASVGLGMLVRFLRRNPDVADG